MIRNYAGDHIDLVSAIGSISDLAGELVYEVV
jgi:hypothetical protein